MKKICYCVVGVLNGKTFSAPNQPSHEAAKDYAFRKGWTDVDVICEGSKEG